ncbi:peroxiredoxin [Nocardiopsis rhodophaea]|uniref:thioredoxin-dependent peroxiredoxin n=1 Tax=Nocardiopsis rhodophaea TaxID=280238 RepID=A0ABP5ETB8_9ACTN
MDTAELAPDFELPDQDGVPRRLTDLLASGPVVLFFYPAAMTPGCTAETCHFRDLGAEFAELGARRVGISSDPVGRQSEFSGAHDVDFPLLSDTEGTVADLYGVRRGGVFSAVAPTKRTTFVIGTDRRVLHIVSSEIRMQAHADGALRALREHAR